MKCLGLCLLMTLAMLISYASADSTEGAAPRVAKRKEALKAGLTSFRLDLWYVGDQDKPYYSLSLHAEPIAVKQNDGFHPYVQVSVQQASKVIDYLAGEGFLERADPPGRHDSRHEDLGPCYNLTVTAGPPSGRIELYEKLGFDLAMLRRLDGLKTALDGEAAKQLDVLLGRLSGYRREWEVKAKTTTASDRTEAGS